MSPSRRWMWDIDMRRTGTARSDAVSQSSQGVGQRGGGVDARSCGINPALVRLGCNVHTEGESPSLVELPTSNGK